VLLFVQCNRLASVYGVKCDDNEKTSSVQAAVREAQEVETADSPDSKGSSHIKPKETGQSVLDTLTRDKKIHATRATGDGIQCHHLNMVNKWLLTVWALDEYLYIW